MPGSYLIDTNAAIARLNGTQALIEILMQADEVFLSSTVLGELYYGAGKSTNVSANIKAIENLAGEAVVLHCDAITARLYGQVKNQLRQKGRPIPENDIWIAATAFQYDVTLITRDGHFAYVDGLRTKSW